MEIAEFIVRSGLEKSKTKAKNLIRQKGFRINDKLLTDEFAEIFFDSETKTWFIKCKPGTFEE